MESYRTDQGPRQRTFLNLGKLDLPKAQWKLLADRIEAIVIGQQSLLAVDEHIEQLATHYARLIIGKQLTVAVHHNPPGKPPQYETIAIDSISNSTSRTDLTEPRFWSLYVMLTNSVMPTKNLIYLFLLKLIMGCGKFGLNRLLRGIYELYR